MQSFLELFMLSVKRGQTLLIKNKNFIAVILLLSFPAWFYFQFPVYNEAKVEAIINRNIPVGTDMKDVMVFLNTLESKGVVIEGDMAYFPDTLFLRSWWYLRVTFEFKKGRMVGYEMDRIKI